MVPLHYLSIAPQKGGLQERQINMLVFESNILSRVQPTARLCVRAMKTIKLGAIYEWCRTSLHFKMASETTRLSLYSIDIVNTDVILPVTINHGQWEREVRGLLSPNGKKLFQFIVTRQRNLE